MNAAATHLAIAGFPLVLNIAGLFLLVGSLATRHALLMRTSLVMLIFATAVSVPVFISGNRSERMVKTVESVNKPAVDPHREASLAATVFLFVEGFLALIAFWRRSRAVAIVVLIFSIVATLTLFYAERLGERIHHPEIEMRTPPKV